MNVEGEERAGGEEQRGRKALNFLLLGTDKIKSMEIIGLCLMSSGCTEETSIDIMKYAT